MSEDGFDGKMLDRKLDFTITTLNANTDKIATCPACESKGEFNPVRKDYFCPNGECRVIYFSGEEDEE